MNNLPAITGNDASLVANTTDVWCKLLEMRGQKVSDERRLAAATILSHIVCPDTMRVSDTTLVNAYPGFGKSAIITTLAAFSDQLPEPFLIVVPTVERVTELVNEANFDGKRRAIGIYSRENLGIDKPALYDEQWDDSEKFRVVVLTNAMFNRVLKSGEFERRLQHYGSLPRKSRHILHDEALTVYQTHRIGEKTLSTMLDRIQIAVRGTDGGYGSKSWAASQPEMRELQRQLSAITDVGNRYTARLEPINPAYKVNKTLKDIYFGHYHFDGGLERLAAIEYIIRHGGILTTNRLGRGFEIVVDAAEPISHLIPSDTNLTVFDGTAAVSPDYQTIPMAMTLDATGYQRYDNLTVLWNGDASYSASWFKDAENRANFFDVLKSDVLSDQPTLVTAFNDVMEDFERDLMEQINTGYVALKPNNGGLGTNDYNEFNRVVISGRLMLPVGAQLCVAELVNGGPLVSTEFDTSSKGVKFRDDEAQDFLARRTAANLIQEITRTRPSDSGKGEVLAVVFGMTDDVLKIMQSHLPGASFREFKPSVKRLSGRKSKLDRLTEVLREIPDDVAYVTNRDMYSALGMSRVAWSNKKSRGELDGVLQKEGWQVTKNDRGLERITA